MTIPGSFCVELRGDEVQMLLNALRLALDVFAASGNDHPGMDRMLLELEDMLEDAGIEED